MTPDTYKRNPLPRHIWFGVALLIAIFVVSFGVFYYSASNSLKKSASDSLQDIKGGIADLKKLQAHDAEKKFSQAGANFEAPGGFFSGLKFVFGVTGEAISNFKNISGQGAVVAREIGFLQENALDFALSNQGDKIITSLKNIRSALESIDKGGNAISSGIGKFDSLSKEFITLYLPLKLNIGSAGKFLDVLISWLDTDSPHHVLVLLENSSEIRPAGGFLGSYADVAIKKGSIEAIDVHDISDADRLLEKKTIPPKPLQALVTNWRAADANWFFNFPDSAEHVMSFLESSKLYGEKSLTFDGVIAVTPGVITDILSFTGPIDLAKSKLSLNQDNFMLELQREVQIGQSSKVTYPKKVLEEFSSALLSHIKLFDAEKKRELLRILQDGLQRKDMMIYFKDPSLEKFLHDYNLSGEVSDLSDNEASSYLAVVDSNVGGGKSDLFMKQDVYLQSQINADGTVSNHLSIDRKHEGNKAKYWWYKVVNHDYLQIFVPPGSHLINFQGGFEKKIAAPINYSGNGYVADDLVSKIESSEEKVFSYPAVSSRKESGKQVFATWVRTRIGETSKVIFDYTHRLALAPTDGLQYKFIFEKQAGTSRHYKFEIAAPVGFRFLETNSPVYEYETDDPPGRLVFDLTLGKI